MKAVAIVPAYNEASRVAAVVEPLRASGRFAQVLVVDDGSTDGTDYAAAAAGAVVLRLDGNHGKGGAMRAGVEDTDEPVVCFWDADLVGLCPEHVHWVLDPVVRGEASMCCGLMDYGPAYNVAQAELPIITGQRAVLRSVLGTVRAWDGFGVEAELNAAAARASLPAVACVLNGIGHVGKWHKVGAARGLSDGAKMMIEVLRATRDAERGR